MVSLSLDHARNVAYRFHSPTRAAFIRAATITLENGPYVNL